MNNSRMSRTRLRALKRLLFLVLLFGALTSAPASADPQGCDSSCISWVKGIGCLDCQTCCVDSNGNFECTHDYDLRDCGTGGPNPLD
jgi:hypothetical protein